MSKILKGAGILALCSLLAKIIGALYRIPLTNIVGAEGIGLYQMVFPLYTVLLTISSGGLPVAISKVVSEKASRGDIRGARQVLRVALITLSIAGLIAGLVIVLLRRQIAFVQGNERAALPYLGIAPSLIFVAIISCFRGYYQGMQNMLPSAMSQLVEQAVKLFAGLALARILINYSLELAVLGALLGVSLSELAAMLLLLLQFFFTNLKYRKSVRVDASAVNFEVAAEAVIKAPYRPQGNSSVLREIYRVAIPVTLGSLVMPITQVIDSILVINLLVSLGSSRADATGLFGLVTGPINSIINMPVVITMSLAVALLPKVTECFMKKESASETVSKGFKYALIVGLYSVLLLSVFAEPVMRLLYSKGLSEEHIKMGSVLLAAGSVSVLYVSLLSVATAVLQGANMAHKPALNLLYGAVFKVILTLVLLPLIGVAGAIAATVLCHGVTCFLDIRDMRKHITLKLKLREFALAPLLSGAAFVLAGIFLHPLLRAFMPPLTAFISTAAIASAIFAAGLILLGAIKPDELAQLPLIGKLIKSVREKKKKTRAAKNEKADG